MNFTVASFQALKNSKIQDNGFKSKINMPYNYEISVLTAKAIQIYGAWTILFIMLH